MKITTIRGPRATCLAAVAIASALTTGCAARMGQFRAFANAGVAYTKASETMVNEAGTAAIRADSSLALKGRTVLETEQERRDYITTNNRLLKEYLKQLNDIKRHGKLLQSYFEALAAMTDSKAPDTLASSAKGFWKAMDDLHPAIAGARIGGSAVSTLAPAVVAPAVSHFKVKALEKELKERSGLIAKELALQEAAVTAIARQLRPNRTAHAGLMETEQVVDPYASARQLPKDWATLREQVLTATISAESADAVTKAAGQLRESFNALVEGRLDADGIASLVSDINQMLDIAVKIHGE
jgi:hypothetical protein